MGKCYIFGGCEESLKFIKLTADDYVIAADSGLKFLLKNNIKINKVIGDFDTLKYIPNDFEIIKLNPIKDVTDTHVCIEDAIKQGYKEIEIYGCLGGRMEHTLATLQDVYHFASTYKNVQIKVYSKDRQIIFLCNNKIELFKEDGFISVFTFDKEAKGVTLKNLKYELDNQSLTSDFPLGVSNEFINKKATIEVKDGCLLIVY